VNRVFLTLMILIFGAVFFQGCSSPEMSTARIAYTRGDFEQAKTKLLEEVRKRPQNGEAWMILADIEVKYKNYEKATYNLSQAKKYPSAKTPPEQIAGIEASVWSGAYYQGFKYLASYPESKDEKLLDSAIQFMNFAKQIRPDNPEIHRMLAIAYENYKKEDEAIESYNKFVEIMKPSIDYAKEKGIFIGMPIFPAIAKLGPPDRTLSGFAPISNDDPDSLLFIGIKDNKHETILFFSDTKRDGKFLLKGWAIDQPASLSKAERTNWRSIVTTPYLALAEIYFNKKEYDKSIENIMIVSTIEPYNVLVNDYIVQIYQAQGKKEEALNVIKTIVDKNPNNSYYIQRYADILATFEKWDEAIKQYEKAIALDKDSKEIYRIYQNLGVCNKNIAAEIYSKQKELADKNIKPLDPKEYEPYLLKSEENYRKALTYPEQKENLDILNDLSDIYYLTNKESDLIDIIRRIELMEPKIKEKDNDVQKKYYQYLIKIYDKTDTNFNDKDFFKEFPKKLERVTKELERL
jgi:tetratricopeptide (TPR) repeat protein